MKKMLSISIAGLSVLATPLLAASMPPVYMANGIKIGEVSATSAIVWTRLTKHAERNATGIPFPENINKERRSLAYPDLDGLKDSVPGAEGDVRITYWPVAHESQKRSTAWLAVDKDGDLARQILLADLSPGSRYALIAQGRAPSGKDATCEIEGAFDTAPLAETPAQVRFTVVTGQCYPWRDSENGHKIYPAMGKLNPNFFVHTGDIEYYDQAGPYADKLELARFKWNRIYAMPYQRSFHKVTASYFMKDDHDTLKNDCWPGLTYGDLTWEQGLALFREQVPMGESTYRTIRWGKDLQIWLVEGRDFRSPNTMPDGPDKTIWGSEQKQWFFDTVEKSDATFRILISPTPLVGPDRGSKNDNHANKLFTHEGDELRTFIGKQQNMFVICGDRHWQYVSEDPATGVREYCCGPTTDKHAGGFREKHRSPMHQYLNVKGGFLSVVIERIGGRAQAVFAHHDIDGNVYNEDIRIAD